jgi:hypothetical protein
MAAERAPSITLPPPVRDDRPASPRPGGLRIRPPPSRSAASAAGGIPLNRRRSSLFSDSFSETQRSLRTSTDDLLLPRANDQGTFDHDPSHWHSVPLGLALLPALGGLFFQNGSAIITDLSLLVLAAVFLNWSVRLPWDWYASAQETRTADPYTRPPFGTTIEEYDETIEEGVELDEAIATSPDKTPPRNDHEASEDRLENRKRVAAAQKELHLHEVLALLSCFLGPVAGAWLLHAIRSQLSRPSEGLVSNYNLTVFLLAAEIRPVSLVIKMVQARTLFLQRVVREQSSQIENKADNNLILDVARRLEELEAHVADKAEKADNASQAINTNTDMTVAKASAQATLELRRSIQPELDALNRAVRRYEKRTTIAALQTESRLQDIEARLKDAMVLAAAVQRNADRQPRNYVTVLANWASAIIVVPVQYTIWVLSLPSRALQNTKRLLGSYLGFTRSKALREQRSGKTVAVARSRERKQKSWT